MSCGATLSGAAGSTSQYAGTCRAAYIMCQTGWNRRSMPTRRAARRCVTGGRRPRRVPRGGKRRHGRRRSERRNRVLFQGHRETMTSRTTDNGAPALTTPEPARRSFLKSTTAALAGGLIAAAGTTGKAGAAPAAPDARPLTEQEKLSRIAINTYPHRLLFKRRAGGMMGGGAAQERAEAMKKKYGEITLLDYPQWTRDHFPGVTHMDLWSSLFGDVTDDTMFAQSQVTLPNGQSRTTYEFDPSLPAAKKWLDRLADNCAKTGVRVHHVSNNAPRNISVPEADLRREGIEVAKKWLDA